MDRYDYKGAVHVHSTYSDGNGGIEEIAAAANDAGLDFVVLTDHNTLAAAKDGHEKWHRSTLLVVGAEISPPDNHFVTFGDGALEGIEKLRESSPQEFINATRQAGWLGFLAHPYYIGSKKVGGGSYKWVDWSVNGFTGLSIWSLLDDWKRQLDLDGVTPGQAYDEFPKHLVGPDPEALRKWDELSQQGRVVAIGEVDNHKMTRKYEEREYVIFPYEMAFRTITNHLLLDTPLSKNAGQAKRQVIEAFRKGSSYISFDLERDPTEFSAMIEHDEGHAFPGDEYTSGEEDELWVSLPEDANIRVIRNGEVLKEDHSFELVVPIPEPGVYRVEVMHDRKPWILTNAMYGRPAGNSRSA